MNHWVILIIVLLLVVGVILSHVFLLKQNKRFDVPKDFKAKKYDDDEDDW